MTVDLQFRFIFNFYYGGVQAIEEMFNMKQIHRHHHMEVRVISIEIKYKISTSIIKT
jgi:hypothetical protein